MVGMKLSDIKPTTAQQTRVGHLLAEWSAAQPYEGHPPGEIGASQLGGCARSIAYQLRSEPESDPITESGLHATAIGTLVHRALQEHVDVDGATAEYPWQLHVTDGLLVASQADLIFWDEDSRPDEVVDIKTAASYPFRLKRSEGPNRKDVLQVGLAMRALGAPTGRVVYVAASELKGRDRITTVRDETDFRDNRVMEFLFTAEEIAPIVERELARLEKISEMVKSGADVPRAIDGVTPRGAVIVAYDDERRKGIWQLWAERAEKDGPVLVDTGSAWQCGYCPFVTTCMSELTEVE